MIRIAEKQVRTTRSLKAGERMQRSRRFITYVAAGALCLLMVAGVVGAQCPSVKTGFGGDINATYGNDYGGGGDGGSGAGGGGGGDAGAGAGEGKVLGGQMTVTRLADGALLGTASTDSQEGLVSIQVCAGDLPVLLTLSGQGGAKYFDEATEELTDFGPGKVLHALIDSFSENVAVSPLTEAAYRFALNNYKTNPEDVRQGRAPLASVGNVTGLTLDQVKAANDVVLDEINRLQTVNMKLVSIKSLPTPIDAASGQSALPANRYGVAAAVLGGLAKMGQAFQSTSQTPAIDTGEQLVRDLTDGKIDGFALDGQPAAGIGVPVAYDSVRLPIAASVGANDISARFGAATVLLRSAPITEQTFAGPSITDSSCEAASDSTTLMRDGTLTLTRTACSGLSTITNNFASQVSLVEGAGTPNAPRTFFVKRDGSVWAWGDTLCGILGNGQLKLQRISNPTQIVGLTNITSIVNGVWFSVARDSSGSVYSWGLDYVGELGLGNSPPGASSCENDYTSPDFKFANAVTTPTKIASLTNIVSVTADGYSPIALDKDGALFQWGLIPTGWDFSKPQPYHGEYIVQSTPVVVAGLPKVIGVAASYAMKMAVAADGTVWGWGPNVVGNFGDGTLAPHLSPTPVPALTGVVEVAASGDSPFVALLRDGTVRYWGGCCFHADGSIDPNIQRVPTTPLPGATQFYSASSGNFIGTLPPIRHIKGTGGQVLLYGSDGSLLQFPKSQQENKFVVLSIPPINYEGLWWNSPAGSESGWGLNLAHQGDLIFATWFTYDLAGKAWWLAMTATPTSANSYSGTLYETHGPPFNAVPFSPAGVVRNAVGSGTLTFHDPYNGTFAYTVNGVQQVKSITRQLFGSPPICTSGVETDLAATNNYQDLWWAAPAGFESGWGVNLTQQGDIIFATWFTYDLDGSPLWLSGTGNKVGSKVYYGPLYKTAGPPFNATPFDPAKVQAVSVGSFTLTFANGNAGTFSYTVNGTTQAKSITREVFRSTGTICH